MHERLLSVALKSRNSLSLYKRGHRPPPPPFARLPPPKNRLHEDIELVWNDGVAPETFIDFEAAHIGKYQALRHLLLAFSGLAGVMGIVALYDPSSMRQAEYRRKCLPDLRWELGQMAAPEDEMTFE
uniref:Uncharacterized protein AlNc14C103G6126 n=1 Tax=Albugo laibachii Nc14 TaxID=890382 RepID=F0WHR9_9STRA|nr:conserved hypothetical protein [Albugo laibachii Nc14]|eukprot:CCA20794.1 conserved hypothetical protein [Albugo laibachii Nc14]